MYQQTSYKNCLPAGSFLFLWSYDDHKVVIKPLDLTTTWHTVCTIANYTLTART